MFDNPCESQFEPPTPRGSHAPAEKTNPNLSLLSPVSAPAAKNPQGRALRDQFLTSLLGDLGSGLKLQLAVGILARLPLSKALGSAGKPANGLGRRDFLGVRG